MQLYYDRTVGSAMSRRLPHGDFIAVPIVSAYLLAVGSFLVLTRKIPAPGFWRVLRALARRPHAGEMREVRAEQGHCYLADVPAQLLSDREHASSLLLLEDGKRLGPAHAPHDAIRGSGGGLYSHWGATLYFSSSDNTDPRTNGRSYTVREERRAAPSTV